VRGCGDIRRCGLTVAASPDRLVGDYDGCEFGDLFPGEADMLLSQYGIDMVSPGAVRFHAFCNVNERERRTDCSRYPGSLRNGMTAVPVQFHRTEDMANRELVRPRLFQVRTGPVRSASAE
jgi:hypothetical protein